MEKNSKTFVGTIEAARITGLSPNTVRSYLRKKLFPAPEVVIDHGDGHRTFGWAEDTVTEWRDARHKKK